MLPQDWKWIYYQCLVCKRLFQYKDLLQNHKKNTPCGKLYPKFIKNLNPHNPIIRAKISSGSSTSQIKIEPFENPNFKTNNKLIVNDKDHQVNIPKFERNEEEAQDQSKSTATADNETPNIDNRQKTNDNSKVGESFDMTRHYQCKFCYKPFETMRQLKMHTSLHVNKGQKHECYFCPAKMKLYDDLVIHMRTHTKERPYVCKICYARCVNLDQHKCNKTLFCQYCKGIHFQSVKVLQQHMLNEHGHIQFPVINEISNHLPFKMEIAERSQDNAQSNRPVLAIYIPPPKEIDKKFFCKVCKRSFFNVGHFKQHIKSKLHRQEFLRLNSIKIKNKLKKSKSYKMESSRSKIQNLKVDLTTKSKNWNCYVCGHAFKLKASLFAHFAVHTGKYRCEFCDRNFRDAYDLRKHFKTQIHKQNSSKKKGRRQFKTNSSRFNTHQNSKQSPAKIIIQTENELEFTCEYCDKSFNTKFGLNGHLSCHKQERVAKKYCAVCNIQFKKYHLFKNHLGGHTHLKNQQIIGDLAKIN